MGGTIDGLTAILALALMLGLVCQHMSSGAILVLDLLAGWTALGWLIAVVWALTADTRGNRRQLAAEWPEERLHSGHRSSSSLPRWAPVAIPALIMVMIGAAWRACAIRSVTADEAARAQLLDQARSNLASNPAHTDASERHQIVILARLARPREISRARAQQPVIDAIAFSAA
jgi:hypothetical protein